MQAGVLSDKDILCELDKTVIIVPFCLEQLGPNSYDTTLGSYYYEQDEHAVWTVFNPFCGKHVAKYWGLQKEKDFQGAQQANKIVSHEQEREYGLKMGDEYIIIKPGKVILAHTNEFIGGRYNVTTMMKSRSSVGRGGLTICACAGSGDVGYFNRYTYEIHNRTSISVVLRVGERIGQIIFFRTGEVLNSYEKRGQYQSSDDIHVLAQNWSPICMIPKCGTDYIAQKKRKRKSRE